MLLILQLASIVFLISLCLALMVTPNPASRAVEIGVNKILGTTGRIAVTAYVVVVLTIAFLTIPGENSALRYSAVRYLPPNTRLSEALLSAPQSRTLEDRNRVNRELAQLNGKFVVRAVEKGGEVKSTNIAAWPSLTDEDLASVEVTGEPDWMLLNSGTKVDVWAAEKWQGASCVLAIVPSDQGLPSDQATAPATAQPGARSGSTRKWLVLFHRSDLGHDGLVVKDGLVLRIRKLPEPGAEPRCVGEAVATTNQASTGAATATVTQEPSPHLRNEK